ncbi:MAG: hypothetical protein KGS48_14025 [Bacteroidetes bacterium]|nr:hypothetical protein [Bacteroidota bacterium]
MKNGIVLFILLFGALRIQAQNNPKYVQSMEKTLQGLDSLVTLEAWQAKSNAFERIAQKETSAWLPQYYVGLCQVRLFNLETDPGKQEALCSKADQFLARADSLNPNNSEVYVLRSMAASMHVRLNPMANGQKYGPIASMLLEKAQKLDPSNPRAVMQKGITLFFTPAQWGGDPVKGKELMLKAREMYAAFKPASSIDPQWGNAMNEAILGMGK